jgi:hypothetical protein
MLLKYVLAAGLLILVDACSSLKPRHDKQWEVLFDGQNIDKFRGYQLSGFPYHAWEVKEGYLRSIPGVKNVDLVTKEEFENFELAFDWKTSIGGNSGVFFYVQEEARQEAGNGNSPNWLTNFEMQILDDVNFYDKEPKRSAGALYDLIAPVKKTLKPVGEYNSARLVVNNKKVEYWLNGNKVVEYEIDSAPLNELVSKSKFKDIPGFAKSKKGHIAFQHHGQEVWFKNIKLRRL